MSSQNEGKPLEERAHVISPDDKLDIYLVSNRLKPASLVSIWQKDPKEALILNGEKEEEPLGIFNLLFQNGCLAYDREARSLLHNMAELQYRVNPANNASNCHLYVADCSDNLARLIQAEEIDRDEQWGIAFGYPLEAVQAYDKIINRERRNATYMDVCLAKAKQAGMKLPLWLAYLSFIPEQMDIVGNNVSAPSKALGEKYQAFVRKNNPQLAEEVEKYFMSQLLPDSWVLQPDGSYELHSDYPFHRKH